MAQMASPQISSKPIGKKFTMQARDETVRKTLQGAKRNLENAQHDFDGEFYESACLFAHLAAEKSLKALLFQSGEFQPTKPIREHDIEKLYKSAREYFPSLEEIAEDVLVFEDYDEQVRYMNEEEGTSPWETYTKTDAEIAIPAAERIFEAAHRIVYAVESILNIDE